MRCSCAVTPCHHCPSEAAVAPRGGHRGGLWVKEAADPLRILVTVGCCWMVVISVGWKVD